MDELKSIVKNQEVNKSIGDSDFSKNKIVPILRMKYMVAGARNSPRDCPRALAKYRQ